MQNYIYKPRGGNACRQRFFEVIFDPEEELEPGQTPTRIWVVDGNDPDYDKEDYTCGIMIPANPEKENRIPILKTRISTNKFDSIYLELEQTYPVDRAQPIKVTIQSGPLPLQRTVRKQVIQLASISYDDKSEISGITQIWNGENINLFTMFYIGDWIIGGMDDD